jgi:hypothetical protein
MTATDATASDAASYRDGVSPVLAWCVENKATASPQLLRVATVLATHPEMERAWRALGKLGMRPIEDVLFYVAGAWSDAAQEAKRPPAAEEREKIERVIRLSGELWAAIEEAPLLKGRRTPINDKAASALLLGPSAPPPLGWAWGDVPARAEGEFTLSLLAAVKSAEQLARFDLFKLRHRMVTRKRGKETPPVVAAFVRYLASSLEQKTGGEQPAVIARIATALFEESPQTPRSVRKILKDSPAWKAP